MKHLKTKWTAAAIAALACLAPWQMTQAQTAEALMEALVKKGILTEQEAEDIKADLAKENRSFVKVTASGKSTLALDLYGDMRGRFEGFFSDDPAIVDRMRFRYRLRAGIKATLYDRFEAGFRLTSSEPTDISNGGGDPISGNSTFQNNGSKKFLFIDLAYGKWTAVTNETFLASATVGKMENPFVLSDMVFDGDYTPEGAAVNAKFSPNLNHVLSFNLGAFALDEISGQSEDPFTFGGQLRFDSNWSYDEAHKPDLQTSVGVAWLGILFAESLTTNAVPNVNVGNTRDPVLANAPLVNDYYPIVGDASITYTLQKVPFYNGTFPIKLAGDVIYNPGAPDKNWGYSAGLTFGKSGNRGTWDLSYRWKYLGGDAWYEEFVDSDFGAFYGASYQQSLRTGYQAGTNVRGHIVKASYSPYNALTLGVTWFYTSLISNPAAPAESDIHRLQVDAVWRF